MSSDVPDVKYTVKTAGPHDPQFEFNQDQAAVMADLAGKMTLVGLVYLLAGVVAAVAAVWAVATSPKIDGKLPTGVLGGALSMGVSGILNVAVGIYTRRAAAGFDLVARTRGQDVTNLMLAVAGLQQLYGLLYWLIILTAIAFAVGLVLMFL